MHTVGINQKFASGGDIHRNKTVIHKRHARAEHTMPPCTPGAWTWGMMHSWVLFTERRHCNLPAWCYILFWQSCWKRESFSLIVKKKCRSGFGDPSISRIVCLMFTFLIMRCLDKFKISILKVVLSMLLPCHHCFSRWSLRTWTVLTARQMLSMQIARFDWWLVVEICQKHNLISNKLKTNRYAAWNSLSSSFIEVNASA